MAVWRLGRRGHSGQYEGPAEMPQERSRPVAGDGTQCTPRCPERDIGGDRHVAYAPAASQSSGRPGGHESVPVEPEVWEWTMG